MDNITLNLIKWAETELKRSDIRCARGDAEALFMDSFSVQREDIYLMRDFKPSGYRLNLFKRYIKLRVSRYPLQYILKNTEFMGLPFALEEGVFIRRPETELLVEKVLEDIRSRHKKMTNILEIGTGCGNIAISLTKNVTDCKIIASDISDKALRVATRNARFHGVKKNIKFVKSDFFIKIPHIFYNYFDIIVSNPPYVRRIEIGGLEPELWYEDVTTLSGGEDGLYFYRRILNDGTRYLKKGGIFALEIGYNQAGDIKNVIKNDDRFSKTTFFKDYNGYDRVAIIKYNPGDR